MLEAQLYFNKSPEREEEKLKILKREKLPSYIKLSFLPYKRHPQRQRCQ
jgi:hypothetical protein